MTDIHKLIQVALLEEQSSATMFTESLSTFLQSHLGVVVDYAEKYGVNIPLNEEEAATARDPNSAQHEEDKTLAALLQSQLEQTDRELAAGKDLLSNGSASNQFASLEEDEGLALKKLIEESLPNYIPELKEQPNNSSSSGGLPDFDSKNLASFITEKLKNELDIPAHGLPNLSGPAHSSNSGEAHSYPRRMQRQKTNSPHQQRIPSSRHSRIRLILHRHINPTLRGPPQHHPLEQMVMLFPLISRCPLPRSMRKPDRQLLPNPPIQLGVRVCIPQGDRGLQRRRRRSWLASTWSRDHTGVRFFLSLDRMEPFPIS